MTHSNEAKPRTGITQKELNQAFLSYRRWWNGLTPLERARELASTAGQGIEPDPVMVTKPAPSIITTAESQNK